MKWKKSKKRRIRLILSSVNKSGERIKTWDEMRGVAILFMVVTHFLYYEARRLYDCTFSNLFQNLNGILDFLHGVVNLHASYLAPFLFLFIVGVISNLKFSRQKKPDIRGAARRFIKLFFASIIIRLIFLYKTDNLLFAFIRPGNLVFNLNGILILIAVTYLINEFILLGGFDYYRRSISLKLCVVAAGSLLIILFNVFFGSVYSNFHSLPHSISIFFGFYMALLGDLFFSLYDPDKPTGSRNILFFIVIPIIVCSAGYIFMRPEFGAIKRMNIVYFYYCIFITYLIVVVSTISGKANHFSLTRNLFGMLGKYSLTLYIFHFFVGYTIYKYILNPYIPREFWFMNSMAVLICCIFMALFFEYVNRHIYFRLPRETPERIAAAVIPG